MEMTFYWQGKTMDECSREELLEAMRTFLKGEQRYKEYAESRTIEKLKEELKIKDDLIEKFISRG